jgi:hypothetical protein
MNRCISICILLFYIGCLSSGCSSSKTSSSLNAGNKRLVTSSAGPRWVWSPGYYVYDNDKYQFVRGHYRLILFRKAYWKKTLQGYSTKRSYAEAR